MCLFSLFRHLLLKMLEAKPVTGTNPSWILSPRVYMYGRPSSLAQRTTWTTCSNCLRSIILNKLFKFSRLSPLHRPAVCEIHR